MVVQCPQCRSKFQVPAQAIGRTATCANQACRMRFVISDPESPEIGSLVVSGSRPSPTPPAGVVSRDGSEISIRLDGGPRQHASVTVQAAPPSNSTGIVSLIVGILALLLCWLPMMNRLGYAIGGLGILLGLLGLAVASQRRGASVGFPIGGLCLSIVGLVIAVQMDQGLQGMKKAVNDAFADSKPKAGNRPRKNAESGAGASATKVGAETQEKKQWADATKNIVTRDDVAMRIKTVRLGTATKIGIAGKQEFGPFLCVTLQVTNTSPAKKVDFEGWSRDAQFVGPHCSLADEHGNQYKQMRSGIGGKWDGQVLSQTIAPQGAMTDVLIFEPPVDAANELRLEIPAESLEREGWFRFSIPRRMFDEKAAAAHAAPR